MASEKLGKDEVLADRLLDIVEKNIIPLTRNGVARGDKIFGAAVLKRDDLSVVVAATNEETASPLWHGEICALRDYFAIPPGHRPDPSKCALLATHEPCPMCSSATAWSGLGQVWFLFEMTETRDEHCIAHDIEIMRSLFGSDSLRRENRYFSCEPIAAREGSSPALRKRLESLRDTYRELSEAYQRGKRSTGIPLP